MLSWLMVLNILAISPFASSDDVISGYDQIFGTPEEFIAKWEDDSKPMVTQLIGEVAAASCFGLVLKALIR